MSHFDTYFQKVPAKVVGCFPPRHLTVIVGGYGIFMDSPREVPTSVIPIDLVPDDLRFPNKTFTVLVDRQRGVYAGIERGVSDFRS